MKHVLLVLSVVFTLMVVTTGCKKADLGGDYVVKIDNKRITEKDLKKEFETLPDMAKHFFAGPEGVERFTDEVVKKEVLYLEALKRGYDKKEDFARKVEEFKKLTLINQLLEEEMKKVSKVTDEELKAFYEKHKDEFTTNTQVRLSQIVVKDEQSAKKVIESLQRGEDFAKVAANMSIDKNSAKSGGDLGFFKKGELNKELEGIAFSLKKGEISNPIPLRDGIHFIKVTDAKGTVQDFEKVKPMITHRAMVEKQRTAFERIIEDAKKSRKIEINKEAMKKVSLFDTPKQPQQNQSKSKDTPQQDKDAQKK